MRLLRVLVAATAMSASPLSGSVWAQDAPAPGKGDPATGEKVFVKCRACHQIGETAKNAIGPELNGVIGRHSGSVPDYNYSEANRNSGLIWDEPTFREYIRNPKAKVPGTKMIIAGLTREKDIDDFVAYLEQFRSDGKKK